MNDSESPDDESTAFEPEDIPYALMQIARLGEGVKSEFDLIANRLTWLVIAESFSFSAFALAISNSHVEQRQLARELFYLKWVTPILGMFLAGCVYIAVLAAHTAVNVLKRQRDSLISRLPKQLRIDLISAQSRVQFWGNLPTHIIPPILFLTWVGVFVLLLI